MFSAALFSVLIFIHCFHFEEAALGFDAIPVLTTAELNCLKKDGNSFFIARIYRSLGKVDTVGIKNIVTARSAGFTDVDGYLFPCLSAKCPSAATQVTDAVNGLKAQGATIGMFWLDIEIFAWPADKVSNQKFVLELANTASNLGYKVGIYTNPQHWKSIVGIDWTGVSQYPLWWPRYNNAQDLTTGWVAFGGWSTPNIHQFNGDSTECGIGLDKSFK
uniref:Lysozyme n=1 Tax=Panagrolaimus superbus TaxID=310955 RepID=A0A914YG92_9BILA